MVVSAAPMLQLRRLQRSPRSYISHCVALCLEGTVAHVELEGTAIWCLLPAGQGAEEEASSC